jgi:hypothetical protein
MLDVVAFSTVAAPLSKALALSLVVERVLEAGKNVLESFLGPKTVRALPPPEAAGRAVATLAGELDEDARAVAVEREAEVEAEEHREKSERLADLRALLRTAESGPVDEAGKAELVTLRQDVLTLTTELRATERLGEWDEQVGPAIVLAIPATDPDSGKVVKTLVLQLLGFATGIVLARFAGVTLFGTFLGAGAAVPVPVDYILTGLLIGGGSGPMHVLIRFITERKTATEAPAAQAPRAAPAALRAAAPLPVLPVAPPIVVTAPKEDLAGWVDVRYDGGVARERLEHVHKRASDPDMIVFHHTAMHSRSTFEDVVRVITNRTSGGGNWLTGYNCVITADGTVHPFCRWDRYGNHAVGYNRRSLGIAFNGNFETDPNVPFSNPDGRMGATRPTEDQLMSGARVAALWTLLYPVRVAFGDAIVPHKQIASKACPGSQFPYDEFQRLVEHFHDRWSRSDAVQERIAAFKLKPYLYVTEAQT